MGQYCYLINKQEKIKVEAYKLSGGGDYELRIEEGKKLTEFLEHCRRNNLTIECVSEYWFEAESDYENPNWKPYKTI